MANLDINDAIISNFIGAHNGGRQDIIKPIKGLHFRTFTVSAAVIYFGFARRDSAADEPVWNIFRKIIISGEILIKSGSGVPYTMVWDDRESYFDTTTISNLYSTLFDGINDYGLLPGGFPYDSSSAFTIACYPKPQNLAAQRCYFANATNDSNVYGWTLYHLPTSGIKLQMRAPSGLRSHDFTDITTPAGVFSHLVMTYSGANNINGANVYVDSAPSVVTPANGPIANSWLFGQDFTLASRNTVNNFAGNMDELMVFDKELTPTEVVELYDLGTTGDITTLSFLVNLMNVYRMGDNDTLPVVKDILNGKNLTLVGGPTFVTDVP